MRAFFIVAAVLILINCFVVLDKRSSTFDLESNYLYE